MATPATIPISALEYRANFTEPIFEAWRENQRFLLATFRALQPWGVSLERVTLPASPANVAQLQYNFEIIPQRLYFSANIGAAILTAWNMRWEDAPLIREVTTAATRALVESAQTQVANQQATLTFHLTPRGRSLREITSKFASPELPQSDVIKAYGFSVFREDGAVVVDMSLQYPASLFVRLARNFGPLVPVQEIENALREEQTSILNKLDVKLDS